MTDLFDQGGDRPFDPGAFLARVEALEREIPANPPRMPGGRGAIVNRVLDRIRVLVERLTMLAQAVDPVRHSDVYDPSHPAAAAELIAEKVGRAPRQGLGALEPFWGSGVYALYYSGDHPAYAKISGSDIPIYVGKADPAIPHALTSRQQGDRLMRRLRDHADSIRESEEHVSAIDQDTRAATGLHPIRLADFHCRYLVLASAFAGAVERNLIRHYAPVWNFETRVCIGFGKHGDSAETRANTRSDWDTLHPGRPWATREGNVPNRRSPLEIQRAVIAHCEARYGAIEPVPNRPDLAHPAG